MLFRSKKMSLAIALCIGTAPVAFAQTTDNTEKDVKKDAPQRVVVTGSNIKRIDVETAAPLQVISRKEIQQSGAITAKDILELTTSNDRTALSDLGGSNSWASGSSGASLRNLGVNSTLVLMLDLTLPENKRLLAKNIFIFGQCMEGTQFYGLFGMVLSLYRQNKFPGIGQMFRYTLRDESNHIEVFRNLFMDLVDENREIWTPELKEELRRASNAERIGALHEEMRTAFSDDREGLRSHVARAERTARELARLDSDAADHSLSAQLHHAQ